jgi:hypothetical protein
MSMFIIIILTLHIACILNELNCPYMAPTNAPVINTNAVLYCSYMFWCNAIFRELYTRIKDLLKYNGLQK